MVRLTDRQLHRRPFRQTHRDETRIRQTHRQGQRHMQPSKFLRCDLFKFNNILESSA